MLRPTAAQPDRGWDEMFRLARAYARAHGDLLVPRECVWDGRRLGAWIGTQRYEYRTGKNPLFTPERREKLESIGMVWDVKAYRFALMCRCLAEYAAEHGTARVPQDYVTQSGERLGIWLNRVRMAYKRGKLPERQRSQLEALGVVWRPEELRRGSWEGWYALLRAYVQAHGAFPPAGYVTATGEKLGDWLANQRQNKRRGLLTPEREARLASLGICWQVTEEGWRARFAQAQEYHRVHGHLCPALERSGLCPPGLASWLGAQRKLRETGRLQAEKAAALETIGMVWDVREAMWEGQYRRAEAFFRQNGHLRLAKRPGEKNSLGSWISTQRKNYWQGGNPYFTRERVRRLEAIGMVWDASVDSAALWEDWYEKAAAYFREHGHLCPERGPLRTWVLAQRGARRGKRGSLTDEQVRRLENIGMAWEPGEEQWLAMYRRAQAYYAIHRMLNVPTGYVTEDGARLGQWIARQRSAYRNYRAGLRGRGRAAITAERIERLNDLGMIWDGTTVTARTSFQEKALLYYLKKSFPDAGKVGREQRFGVELDIYIPSLHTAIEYDGCRWHADKLEQDEGKGAACRAQGIRLFRIREPGLPAVERCDRVITLPDLGDAAFDRAAVQLLRDLGADGTDVDVARDRPAILAGYRDATARAWARKYRQLCRRCAGQGPLSAPNGAIRGAGELTAWVNDQREAYRRGELTRLQVEKLEALGLCWSPFEAQWRRMYTQAQVYREAHGDLMIPCGYLSPEGDRLGDWLARQRYKRRKGELTPRQIQELERLGMVWEPHSTRRRNYLAAARRQFERTGSLDVPSRYVTPEGVPLGRWLRTQRRRHEAGTLGGETARKLEELGMCWSSPPDRWEEMFRLAEAYFGAHGDLWVSPNYVTPEGMRLGGWVSDQRSKYFGTGRHSRLTPEQQRRLEAIGMVWQPYTRRWMDKYRLARAFFEANGHLNIPVDYVTPEGVKLGMWIASQRQAKRGNPNFLMTPERERLLEEIGMDWTLRRTKPNARQRRACIQSDGNTRKTGKSQ